MLDLEFIRQHPELVQQNAAHRRVTVDITHVLHVDEQVRNHIHQVDVLRKERNDNAALIKSTSDKKSDAAKKIVAHGQELKKNIATLEQELEQYQQELHELLMTIPNMTHPSAPVGASDADNVELRQWGTIPSFDFQPADHLALGTTLDLYDFERGAIVAGSGFYYTKNEAVLLEQALLNFALHTAMNEGYTPVATPDIARREILEGAGYQPRGNETQIYNLEHTDLSLIATAEIPLAGYYTNTVFNTEQLEHPIRLVGISHCFRTEAGSYGKESRGLYRVHQFSKVELFVFCRPEQSEELHEELLRIEEHIMQSLQLPYRVVENCTGDLGGPAYRKYDIEAWMPFKNGWGEVTSASNCTDFQARRLRIQYTTDHNTKAFVHTLNGTAIVTSRIPIAVLENNQRKDGSIDIPSALRPYMNGVKRIKPKTRA